MAGVIGINTYYYKRKGAVLSTDELNSIFDGGDIYVSEPIAGVSSRFLIQSYRFGGASCFQKAIDIDHAYKTYVRGTADGGVSWTDWKEM